MGRKKALLEAVKAGDDAKVQKVLAKSKGSLSGIDVCDEAGYSPLTHAAMLGYCKILRYMMQAGADMNKKDAQNRSALYVAALCDRVEVVRVLIEYEGIEIDAECGKAGHTQTPLEAALELNNTGIVAVLGKYCGKWLVEAAKNSDLLRIREVLKRPGIHLEAQDFTGWTALHVAMKNDLGDIVEELAKAGMNADMKNRNGQTPLDVANDMGHTHLIELYLNAKQTAVAPTRFETPEKQAERTARQSGHTTQADLLKHTKKRKSLPAGIMRRIAHEEELPPSSSTPVVMTKEAWKHKDGASSKDADLLMQLNALKNQMTAATVQVVPVGGGPAPEPEPEAPLRKGGSMINFDVPFTRGRSESRSAPVSPREGAVSPSEPVKVSVKGSWTRKGGAGKESELMKQLTAMKEMMQAQSSAPSAKPATMDIAEAQRLMRQKREASEERRSQSCIHSLQTQPLEIPEGSRGTRALVSPGRKPRVTSLPAGAEAAIRQKLKGLTPPPPKPEDAPERQPALISSGGRPGSFQRPPLRPASATPPSSDGGAPGSPSIPPKPKALPKPTAPGKPPKPEAALPGGKALPSRPNLPPAAPPARPATVTPKKKVEEF